MTFKDETGTEWSIDLNGQTASHIFRDTSLDVADLARRGIRSFRRMSTRTLATVLWRTCFYQAVARGVGPKEFGQRVAADGVATQAFRAFIRSIAALCPDSKLYRDLQRAERFT